MKIVGVEHRTGNYKGFDYDNYIIHTVDESPFGACIAGGLTDTYKVKANTVRQVFGGVIQQEKDFENIIGRYARIMCDKYGKPRQIRVSDSESGLYDDDEVSL